MYTLLKKSLVMNWVYVLAWASGIYVLSSQTIPPDTGTWLPPFTDKIIHAIIYAILAYLLFTALYRTGLSKTAGIIISVVIASLFGITDEWHQSSVPGRTADIYDWVADTVGALAVLIMVRKRR